MSEKYMFNLNVEKEDIDHLGHVNNLVYLKWVLKAAELHWNHISTNEINEKYVWVVLRHEIDYLGQALLKDEISVVTYVTTCAGVKSDRCVEIYKNEKLLTKAVTTWCLLDKLTMRPARITNDIQQLFGF